MLLIYRIKLSVLRRNVIVQQSIPFGRNPQTVLLVNASGAIGTSPQVLIHSGSMVFETTGQRAQPSDPTAISTYPKRANAVQTKSINRKMSQSTPWLIITAHLVQPVVGILVDIDPIECPYQQFSLPFGKATHPVGRQTAISRRIGRYFMRTGIYSVQAVGQETDPDVMGSIFIDS